MTTTPIAPAELTTEPAPRPGQVEIDPTALCAAPLCGIPVIGHTGTPYTVDGFPVGSATCADRLHRWRRAALVLHTTCTGCRSTIAITRPPIVDRCYWCTTGTSPEQLAAESHLYALAGGAR